MGKEDDVGGVDIGGHFMQDGVAEILHDLKSPLTVIALEASALDERIARGDRCGAARAADRITRNVAFMDRMVLDLMDACASARVPLPLFREPTELRALIEGVIDRVVPERDRSRIQLDAPHAHTLLVDRYRIERVVSNLLDNALKYAVASNVLVRISDDDSFVRVSVIDAGPGIPACDRERVFDRFTRTETSRGRHGSGLGLYVSKRIIEAHGGRIGIENARDIGAHFFFDLPTR